MSLPVVPADPLHILPPNSLRMLAALLVLGLLTAFFLLLRYLALRNPARSEKPTLPPTRNTQQAVVVGIDRRIDDLETKYLKSQAFRDGCHALAVLVKQHLAQVTGLATEEMTSREIAEAFEPGGGAATQRGSIRGAGPFMSALADRRYGRKEPERRHFEAACDEARSVLAGKKRGQG